MIAKLDEALESKDFYALGDLIYDCECDNLETQIDLTWYQARIIESEQNSIWSLIKKAQNECN